MRRNSDRSRVPSVSSGRAENSTFAATQRTETGIPKTRLTPSSRMGRRRSATSLKKLWASGKPRVTTAPSTPTGRQARISGLVGGLLLITSTISAQRSRRSWRVGPTRVLDAGDAGTDDGIGGRTWAAAGALGSVAALGAVTVGTGIGAAGRCTGWNGGKADARASTGARTASSR